jgi:26S proteasome regulatory subunit N10
MTALARAGRSRLAQVATLALKHRQNKHQRQRIIIFVGSPLKEDQKELVKLGKKLKKNDVAVDVINFGETAENQEKLEAFIGAVNKNENSSLLTVPPGPHILSDIIISSSICNSDGDGGGGGGMGAGSFDVGGGGGAGGFDADLEMALRISAEEERQRQEREAARIAGEGGAAAPAEGGATATTAAAMGAAMADDDDDMLQQALAMSMAESQQNPAATMPKSEVPASASKAADAMEEDGDEELKLAMAMSQGAAGGDASGGMNGLLQDAGFLNDVLSSLPGVDTSDPRVQGVLDGMKDDKKEEKKEDSK